MNNNDKYNEFVESPGTTDPQEERRILRRASIAVIIIVLALVAVLSCAVYVVELYFGKTAGTVTLVVLALIIAGYLYRKEIKDKFKRK